MVGSSFEGFVIENLIAVLPYPTRVSFYRSRRGAEIDLLLALPQQLGIWAIEIKSGFSARPSRGFYHAIEDICPAKCFVVYAGKDRYKIAANIEAISLQELSVLVKECDSNS